MNLTENNNLAEQASYSKIESDQGIHEEEPRSDKNDIKDEVKVENLIHNMEAKDESPEEHLSSNFEFIDIDQNVKKTPANLQEAFLKYRKKRQKEIKRVRKVKHSPGELQLKARADPQRMQWLRMKFLEQSKKYFGVPYAKKYWTKDKDEYYSPIFLDCCGLVRRCMRDLKRDFGFRIGPWNQAYMYDTLPITIDREEDMKPGDLVFISAIYYNKKSKKQPHNMTHVEIWLGDGPKTIGARWNNGKVQVFDSYKFTAKSYHSETYIFKSIDTWLMGICRSHCPDHMWKTRSERFKPSKKSVFSVSDNQQDEPDQSAGDSDVEPEELNDLNNDILKKNELKNELPNVDLGVSEISLNDVNKHTDNTTEEIKKQTLKDQCENDLMVKKSDQLLQKQAKLEDIDKVGDEKHDKTEDESNEYVKGDMNCKSFTITEDSRTIREVSEKSKSQKKTGVKLTTSESYGTDSKEGTSLNSSWNACDSKEGISSSDETAPGNGVHEEGANNEDDFKVTVDSKDIYVSPNVNDAGAEEFEDCESGEGVNTVNVTDLPKYQQDFV